jgi:molybdopterin-guanine dinucleotide biosynthesis protein A
MAVHSRAPWAAPAGVLLTGGASRRMGRDKALLVVDGRTLAERGAQLLSEVAAPVVEVGPGHSGLPAVREDPPGTGPLAALCAGAAELRRLGHDGAVLLLAVDMPFVTTALLRLLAGRPGAATAVPRDGGGRPQPLCARYGAGALAVADRLVAAGERSLRALLTAVSAEIGWVDRAEWAPVAGPDPFRDLDTPEDLASHDGFHG